MLQLQIVSDLHLEFREVNQITKLIQPVAKILILAGDICPLTNVEDIGKMKILIEWASLHYEKVIHVLGNHEFYSTEEHRTINQVFYAARNLMKLYPKYMFLNNSSIRIQNYVIYGTTLWTNIPESLHKQIILEVNDYRYIYTAPNKRLTPDLVSRVHKRSVDMLVAAMLEADKAKLKMIVISHHKPYISTPMIEARNFAYQADLAYLMGGVIKLWCYGHTHKKDNTRIGTTMVYSNPKGYPYEKMAFNRNEVIAV